MPWNPIDWAERGLLPDPLVRLGVRRRIAERRRSLQAGSRSAVAAAMDASPIAVETGRANEQHYEVPTRFFESVLGPRRKYSCALFDGDDDLARAEERMLAKTCARAGVEDGMALLDLGCGWGSLTLWLAEHYPAARILAVSNSTTQRRYILERARAHGYGNVEVRTANAVDFEPGERFDRVLSVEMFEHMRNWRALFSRIESWLTPRGSLFLHVFAHHSTPYFFEDAGAGDWMARTFFSGGLMPSYDLVDAFDDRLRVVDRWRVDGTHYACTSEAWLRNLDARREDLHALFADAHGPQEADRLLGRWRLFFIAVAELFAARGGTEWFVAHYRLARKEESP